ncbi:MAG: repeat-containing protein [Chthonomonadales bacterium]|nr:repeat-containing protein [Chthonomonadales bacterium]
MRIGMLALCPALAWIGSPMVLTRWHGGQAQAVQASPPGAPEALALVQRGDAAGAVKIMEAAVVRQPKSARVWRVLGYAALKAKNLDRALSAYRTSLEIEPGFPAALYNTGVAYALKQDKEQAFHWLEEARATQKMDMTLIQADPDLVSLKEDPRFTALLPKPELFAHPFVETVKVIHEWDGEAMNDQFGWIARNMGDVDGDRIHDVVTSAPTKEIGGANAGRVYLYSTRTGKLLWKVDGQPGDQLGLGVECAGDTNHDGVPDVIAGAPGAGKAYVYSGKDGHPLLTLKAEDRQDVFGAHVAGVGDIDHDGYADVMVGAPGNNAGGAKAGRAYVYSGKDGHLLLTLTGEHAGDGFGSTVAGATDRKHRFLIVGAPGAGPKQAGRTYVYNALSQKPQFVIEADETGSALGNMFVSVAGDLDGDGVPDIYASDFGNSAKGPATGRIYLRSGKDGHPLLTLTGETAGEGFGIGRADAGDVDHDGHDDLIVGAWQYAGAAVSGGRATLYSGKDGHVLNTYTCRVPGDTFGFDAVGIGDVDGDGITDLLLTSAWSGIHGYHSGRMFIISSGIPAKKR